MKKTRFRASRAATWRFCALLGRELTPPRLHKPRLFSLDGDLTNYGANERGMRRLPAGAGPQRLGLHRLDQFLGVHRLLGAGQDLGRGVDGAEFPILRFLGLL